MTSASSPVPPVDSKPRFEAASFRDPAGRVFHSHGRIFRLIANDRVSALESLIGSEFYQRRSGSSIVETRFVDAGAIDLPDGIDPAETSVVEHGVIEVITYPFEWPFALLKRAACFHLDLHIEALKAGFTLTDASAYNVQFDGVRPVFMDVLSFDRYREGALWAGYRQFCEEFLGPLVLTSTKGIGFNEWYRGTGRGIGITEISRALPLFSKIRPRVMTHFVLHALLTARADSTTSSEKWSEAAGRSRISKTGLVGLLRGLRRWCQALQPKGVGSYWSGYDDDNSYDAEEIGIKENVVGDLVRHSAPKLVLDLGCNTGRFSEVCISSGAERVVGVDFDHGALDRAVDRASEKALRFTPLYLDLTNPSPAQGWAGLERSDFFTRIRADFVVALAVLHHLVIGRNIPLFQAVRYLTGLAVGGLIEFVPRDDPMVKRMLLTREQAFDDYNEEAFRAALASHARIVSEQTVTQHGRILFSYEKG
jgi:ribosomal protein L11 methylase PrmA